MGDGLKRKPEYRWYKGKRYGPYGPYLVTVGVARNRRQVSRQRAHAIKMNRMKLCIICARPKIVGKARCARCLVIDGPKPLVYPGTPIEA